MRGTIYARHHKPRVVQVCHREPLKGTMIIFDVYRNKLNGPIKLSRASRRGGSRDLPGKEYIGGRYVPTR